MAQLETIFNLFGMLTFRLNFSYLTFLVPVVIVLVKLSIGHYLQVTGSTTEISQLIKSSLLFFFRSFFTHHQTIYPELPLNDTDFGPRLASARYICLALFCFSALWLRLFFVHLVQPGLTLS